MDHATWKFIQIAFGFIVIGIIVYYSRKRDQHQLQKQVKSQQTPIAQQTNRVRYAVYGTQYPVSTARYMVLSPAAHRGKSSTTAKKWREIKGLEWLCNNLQIHP